MSFAQESLQSRIVSKLIEYKKITITVVGFIIAFILGGSLVNISYENKQSHVTNIVIECQQLEKEKKYIEAYDKLENTLSQNNSFFEDKNILYNIFKKNNNNVKMNYLIICYQNKLAYLSNNIEKINAINQKIAKINYISQFVHYDDFSIIGELMLDQQIMNLYNQGKYEECANYFNEKKMQKMSHFNAMAYKALALNKQNKKLESKNFLSQVLLYFHDYSPERNLKEIIKVLLSTE